MKVFEIGWFVLNKVENGIKLNAIYDLLDEVEADSDMIMYTNLSSPMLEEGVYASGFIINDYYEESVEIEKMLLDICNDLESLNGEDKKDFEIKLSNGECVIVRVIHELFFDN